jgi:hypothetical protein
MELVPPWPKPQRKECYFYHSIDLPDEPPINGEWDLRDKFGEYRRRRRFQGQERSRSRHRHRISRIQGRQHGARRVVAYELDELTSTDRVPFRNSAYIRGKDQWSRALNYKLDRQKRGFWYAWHSLKSSVEVSYGSIQKLLSEEDRFDIVLAGALMDHVADPVTAIGACCRLADETVIVAFIAMDPCDEPLMRPLIPWETAKNNYAWWLLSAGLYNLVFANMGFSVEYLPCSIDFNGAAVPRQTILARRIRP